MDALIAGHHEVVCAVAVFEERFAQIDRALTLQAGEYERRLESLNHEAQRVAAIQTSTVSAARFNDYVDTERRAVTVALRSTGDQLDAERSRLTKLETQMTGTIAVREGVQRDLAHLGSRFDEYVNARTAARDAASLRLATQIKTLQDTLTAQISADSDRLDERITSGASRLDRLETELRTRSRTGERINAWAIAGVGFVITAVIIISNLVTQGHL